MYLDSPEEKHEAKKKIKKKYNEINCNPAKDGTWREEKSSLAAAALNPEKTMCHYTFSEPVSCRGEQATPPHNLPSNLAEPNDRVTQAAGSVVSVRIMQNALTGLTGSRKEL